MLNNLVTVTVVTDFISSPDKLNWPLKSRWLTQKLRHWSWIITSGRVTSFKWELPYSILQLVNYNNSSIEVAKSIYLKKIPFEHHSRRNKALFTICVWKAVNLGKIGFLVDKVEVSLVYTRPSPYYGKNSINTFSPIDSQHVRVFTHILPFHIRLQLKLEGIRWNRNQLEFWMQLRDSHHFHITKKSPHLPRGVLSNESFLVICHQSNMDGLQTHRSCRREKSQSIKSVHGGN